MNNYKAKLFYEQKQKEHFEEYGVYFDTNCKISEIIQEFYNKELKENLGDLLMKEAVDFVMWCKENTVFIYQYEEYRRWNEANYKEYKKSQNIDESI